MKEDKRRKGEGGITLVALIITIIVLIILAAITIVNFMQFKIIETATEGSVNYAKSQSNEVSILNSISDMLDGTLQRIKGIGGDDDAGGDDGSGGETTPITEADIGKYVDYHPTHR